MFGGLASISQGQGINILLNLFFGPMVNAARAVAYQIQTAVNHFVINFLMATRPQVIKSFAEHNYERMYSLTFKSARYSFFLMLALILPICFELRFILNLWLGKATPPDTYKTYKKTESKKYSALTTKHKTLSHPWEIRKGGKR